MNYLDKSIESHQSANFLTSHNFNITVPDRMQHSYRKFKRYSPSSKKSFRFGKVFRRKEQFIEIPSFSLLGGNRSDPLNLNELIEKKKQSSTNSNGNHDRLVEILLPPDIYDPLGLDLSLSSNYQFNDVLQLSRNR